MDDASPFVLHPLMTDPSIARMQAILDHLRQRAYAVGLSDAEIETINVQARDEALTSSAGSPFHIYRRMVEEAIAERSAR